MKKKLLSLIPYTAALAINFYVLPLLIKDTGSAIFAMLLLIPIITFICGIVYGVRQGFNFLFPILTAMLFTPTIFIFYNSSAWVYIIGYAIIALIGNIIGRIFNKMQSR